jgi:hypothetical protein
MAAEGWTREPDRRAFPRRVPASRGKGRRTGDPSLSRVLTTAHFCKRSSAQRGTAMRSILVSGVLLSLGLSVAVQAGDLCLDVSGGTPTIDRPVIILRGFKFPKKNKCKPCAGVISTSIPSRPSAVTGTACTSFDGGRVSFVLYAALVPGEQSDTGAELRYAARVTPTSPTDGTVRLAHYDPPSTSAITGTAFECHDAFPDNL